jgi:threonine dehydrogenase-like Zn-dependent dehydrogenase
LKYGYASVGRITAIGNSIDQSWNGRLVFSLHPHESHYVAWPDLLLPVPAGLSPEDAAFLANMETAVNFVMDGRPMIGEKVAVFGQGVVGLLTAALLSRFPLADLTTVDAYLLRRERSLAAGAHRSIDPADVETLSAEFDLTYELSGNPATLDAAIAATGYSGRIVVGSWYGDKRAAPNLGGHFHRDRIRLISSQVSTIAPELLGRWDKARRFETAWRMLKEVRPSQFITHRFPLSRASEAYSLLDERPGEALQVVLEYGAG